MLLDDDNEPGSPEKTAAVSTSVKSTRMYCTHVHTQGMVRESAARRVLLAQGRQRMLMDS